MSLDISAPVDAGAKTQSNVWSEIGRWLPLALGALLVSGLYTPTLKLLGNVWWTDENYSHGLIVPFIIAVILWLQRSELKLSPSRGATLAGAMLVIFALGGLRLSVIGPIYFLGYISFWVMLAGISMYMGGFRLMRALAVPFALLALAIPLPTVVMNSIAAPLQIIASRCAVWNMQLFGISLVREGNVIEMLPFGALKTQKLEVVQACSGVRSLFSLLFMSVLFAYFTNPRKSRQANKVKQPVWWRRFNFWRWLCLVAAAIPIAVITNALRVSGTGVLSYYYGLEMATGFFHTFAGALTYLTAACLLLSLGWLLDRMRKSRISFLSAKNV